MKFEFEFFEDYALVFCPFRTVRVQPPAHGRKAEKKLSQEAEEDTGPFIFSPFSSLTANTQRAQGKMGAFVVVVFLFRGICYEGQIKGMFSLIHNYDQNG